MQFPRAFGNILCLFCTENKVILHPPNESYTQFYTRICLYLQGVSLRGVGNVGFFSKTFFRGGEALVGFAFVFYARHNQCKHCFCSRLTKTFRKSRNIGLLWVKVRMFCPENTDVSCREVRCFRFLEEKGSCGLPARSKNGPPGNR